MPKTRGRKRHARKTRRRSMRHSTRRSGNKRRNTRMRGGRSNKPTIDEMDGEPIIKDAVITMSDGFSGGVKDAEDHFTYRDFQGPEQM